MHTSALIYSFRFGDHLSQEEMEWHSEALLGGEDDDEMRRNKPFKLLGVRTYRKILDALPASVSKRLRGLDYISGMSLFQMCVVVTFKSRDGSHNQAHL